jgi:broad specificity phosphatase PhoE
MPTANGWLPREISERRPSSVVMRHAERYPISSVHDSLGTGLTPKGMTDSAEFGRSIGGRRQVRLFHSPAVRCRETAMWMAKGLEAAGHSIISIEESPSLCAPYLTDACVLTDADRLGHGFMRKWFDGSFDPRRLLPTPEAADMVLSPIIADLLSAPEDGLSVHVSHDWEVVLLKEELIGIRHEDAGWADYLSGLVLTLSGGEIIASSPEGRGAFRFKDGRRRPLEQGP